MSGLMEVQCVACSKPLRFKRPDSGRLVALTCPACGHFFQVPLDGAPAASRPVIATPIEAPLAPIDEFLAHPQLPHPQFPHSPQFSRPVLPTRPQTSAQPALSPQAMLVTAGVLVGVLLVAGVGYGVYAGLRSLLKPPLALEGTPDKSSAGGNDAAATAQPLAENSREVTRVAEAAELAPVAVEKQPAPSPPETMATAAALGAPAATAPAVTTSASSSASQEDLADVIARAEQSVVRIEVTSADGDSLGSGFVVDNQGTLVTNCHVLAGALNAVAHFPDGSRCVIAGTRLIDPSRDIVVAKLATNMGAAIGITDHLPRKGEQVTALGAPHGLAFTATRGIVSAIRQGSEIGSEQKGTWIQVDAALSPGNSGGPLINAAGEVVAMSTLASQGTAQNLNFGISAQDIRQALQQCETASTLSLAAGVGRVKMKDAPGDPGGDGPIVQQTEISDAVLAAYVKQGLDDFSELLKSLRNETTRLSLELREMKRGETYLPPALRQEDAAVARVLAPGQRTPKWFFLNEDLKQEVVARQLEKIKTFTKLRTDIQSPQDAESVFQLLWNHGPPLDVRRNHSIGYVDDLLVLHAFNEHDVLVLLDETPYMLWAPSTAGMSGGELWEGPAYVAGTTTASLRSGLTTSVTVLQLVTEEQLRQAVQRALQPGDGYRTWSDLSGTFSIEAKLLGKDSRQAVLQKRDGSIINVPRDKLSPADIEFLER